MDTIQLNRLQLSCMGCWLIGSFFGRRSYASLCISSSVCLAVFVFFFFHAFFPKCPLIGSAVTVSCFKHPMWHLKMAHLTPAPAERKPHIWLPKPMNRVVLWCPSYLIFFNLFWPTPLFLLYPLLPTKMIFKRRSHVGPLPKQNPLGFNTFS